MYNEKSYKKHLFWISAKRVFLIILFTIVGTALGIVISEYMVDILLFSSNLRNIIIIASGLLFLIISLLLTANTGKEIYDGYWRIAVFNELTTISEKLSNIDEKIQNQKSDKKTKKIIVQKIKKEEPKQEIDNKENQEDSNEPKEEITENA